MSSPYAQKGGGGGSPYAQRGTTGTTVAPKQGGHGILHILGQTVEDLKNVALNAPGGIYHAVGQGVVSPIYNEIAHGPASPEAKQARARSGALAKATVESTAQDFQHPLRHPGYTLLDTLGVVNGGVGAASRVAEVGKTGELGALLRHAPLQERIIHVDGKPVVTGAYSRAAATRGAQKLLDQVREQFPNVPIAGRSLKSKAGFQMARRRHIEDAIARVPALALLRKAKGISMPQNVALRVVAEGVPISERLAKHKESLAGVEPPVEQGMVRLYRGQAQPGRHFSDLRSHAEGFAKARGGGLVYLDVPKDVAERYNASPRVSAGHGREYVLPSDLGATAKPFARAAATDRILLHHQIRLLNLAKRYVADVKLHDGSFKPIIAPKHRELIDTYEALKRSAQHREDLLNSFDLLTPDAELRKHKPARIFGNDTAKGEAYIPYSSRRGGPQGAVRVGANRVLGNPRTPSSLRKEFTGASIERGQFRNDTAHLVAEHDIEAVRFTELLRNRKKLEGLATDTPQNVDRDIPVRMEEIRNQPLPREARLLMDKAIHDEPLTLEERGGLSQVFQAIHQHVFPDPSQTLREVQEQGPIKGVKWIDERLLGGLNKPNPLVGIGSHLGGKRALKITDAVNNASKLAILYLKPAYALPNLLGNAAFALIQQGFAAPKNLRNAARINAHLSDEAAATIDAAMGEGISASLTSPGGLLAGAANYGASKWSKIVDLPFRRSAFLHEAGRAGYKTWPQVEKLLTDKKLHEKLITVAQEANSELVDYSRLGPIEREVVRRVIFFYPWVKGSSVYAARFLGEHPVQAGVTGQLGKMGKQQADQELGPRPSYAEGLFKVGERNGNPLAVNPAAATIFGTPGQVLEAAKGVAAGNVGSAFQPAAFLTPTAQALITLLAGTNSFGQQLKPNQSRLGEALSELHAGLPQEVLAKRLTQKPSPNALYPYTPRDALLQFLVGGVAPRPVNRAKLNEFAAREKSGR